MELKRNYFRNCIFVEKFCQFKHSFSRSWTILHRASWFSRNANFNRSDSKRSSFSVIRGLAVTVLPMPAKTRDEGERLRNGLERVSIRIIFAVNEDY